MGQEEIKALICKLDDMIKEEGGYKRFVEVVNGIDADIKDTGEITNRQKSCNG